MQPTDPFRQYLLGEEAQRRQDYTAAIGHCRHALRLCPGAHLLFAVARASLLGGDPHRANWAMQQALAHAEQAAQPR